MNLSNSRSKRILICLAHPDDESFGMGGTIAHYSNQGVEIRLICATRGEAGTVDKQYLKTKRSIAELREGELRCAAKVLGIADVIYLDYRDSGMLGSRDNEKSNAFINAKQNEVVEKIVREIRQFRPQVILTFDSTGGYHHPDHIVIHEATKQAFHSAGDQSQFPKVGKAFTPDKLFYNSRSRKRVRMLIRLMPLIGRDPKKLGRNQDIDLTKLARDKDTPVHITINYHSVGKQKRAADNCHASQLGENGLTLSSLIRFLWRFGGQKDEFTRAFPITDDHFRAQDLFAD